MNPVRASFLGKHRLVLIRAISGLLVWAGVSAVASAMSFFGEIDREVRANFSFRLDSDPVPKQVSDVVQIQQNS